MNKVYKIMLSLGILMTILVATFVAYDVFGDGTRYDNNSLTTLLITISQIPIWISLAAANQDSRKKKNEDNLKNEDFLNEKDYYQDKMLSSYDGEIIAYDEAQEQQMHQR